jgi:hypothetical protein
VLGELIYALEYRDRPIETPYALEMPDTGVSQGKRPQRQITVPRNLYVIGTMNTADRSIGHLDYAVRRRFSFVHCYADKEIVASQQHPARRAAVALFEAVQDLFDTKFIAPEFSRDDVVIGHTYFLTTWESGHEPDHHANLMRKFVYQVYPILREYVKDGILRPPPGGPLALPRFDKVVLDRDMRPNEVHQAIKDELSNRRLWKEEG